MKIRQITDEERSKAIGKDASEYVCGPAGCYPGQPCRPFCYMTEMTAQGWQQCPSLHVRDDLKKPDLSIFIEILRTLADQGAIDVEPTERGYDLTKIYDWLVWSNIAFRKDEGPYWLYLLHPVSCEGLADLLEYLKPKYDGEAIRDKIVEQLEREP